ncbi:hypothetical protein [Paenibacillus tarimensis]|uniref:hypothetical protein n=1 Tax=Paenibacillus tarimensis TaxID=416012 RepID=UPI001F450D0E|nr:hypothetical protein [Paenibacillus tarimensis]MCF2945582.1 hypothetical protein [Paenibacillus tarimensis]
MGIESYNFLLYPKKNIAKLTEYGWETYGGDSISSSRVIEVLESMKNVKAYTPKGKRSPVDEGCYYSYVDESSIIEIEVNSGEKAEIVEELSVRFAVVNPEGTFEKTLQLCRDISESLKLNVLNMKLHEVIDFSNEIQLTRSEKIFNEKRRQFFSTFDLPEGIISRPLYCSEVFDILQGKR